MGELAGTEAGRVPAEGRVGLASAPIIASTLGAKDPRGLAQKRGYYFRVYLPTASGPAVAEPQRIPGVTRAADANAREQRWCAYAWPATRGTSGNRTFFVNEGGEVWATVGKARPYTGTTSIPAPDAAYDAAAPGAANLDGPIGEAPAGRTARDGNRWFPTGG